MKRITTLLLVVLGLVVIVMGLQMVASETGEVVVLGTVDAAGAPQETRLWIVDYEGAQYLRAGSAKAQWYARLVAQPRIEVERNGSRATYVATPAPAETKTVNELMAAKYGWADAYIGMMFSRDNAMAIRLTPTT
jgi:hypothetical protein